MKISRYLKYLIRRLSVHGKRSFFKDGYKLLYPECIRRDMTPWQHYVIYGSRKGFSNGGHPSDSVFFSEGYELEYPDVKASGTDPWRHYAERGLFERRDNGLHPGNDLFFAEGYLRMYPDVAMSGIDPWHHYALYGKKEGRDNGHHPEESKFFADGYLEMYPDVAEAQMDPWMHYVLCGMKEGRDNGYHPDEGLFCARGYLRMYPEAAGMDIDPWINYIKYGKKQNMQRVDTPYSYVKVYNRLWYIDTAAIDAELEKFRGMGVQDNEDSVIVSLTSFPARINEVRYTVYSLLNQTLRPNKVVLWLASDQFPGRENDLPDSLLKLRQNGLSIEWCSDIKSYKKLIPSLKEYPDSIIVTADDDIYYEKDWLKKIYDEHQLYPDDIIAHRCHYISIENGKILSYLEWKQCVASSQASVRLFFTGCGGVLYPPHSLFRDVTDESKFMELCPAADDIWFWGMSVLSGRKMRCVRAPLNKMIYINPGRELSHDQTLGQANMFENGNDRQLKRLLDCYPGLYKKLIDERDIKVSVIIPVWNAEKYVRKCLDSLISQTLKDIEIICVNDGSTDHSLDILKEYAEKDPRVRIISQSNQGQSVARNNAMAVARGEFIGFCDNDDWVSENYFEALYNAAVENRTDIAATPNVFFVDPETNQMTRKDTGMGLGDLYVTDRGKVVISTGLQWNKIYSADFLKRNHIKCTTIRVAAEDNYFTVQAMMYCRKIVIVPEAEYYFYRRSNATSKLVKTRKDFCVVDLYKSIDELIKASRLDDDEKKTWLNIMSKRKTGDLSLFYNEMEPDLKDDFKSYVAEEFPDIVLNQKS